MSEQEIWKDIEGCEGRYQVSNMGRVRSRCKKGEWRLRAFDYNRFGYAAVHFQFGGKSFRKYVHRLVADAFVPGYKEGLFVNHINENKQDNRACNLEWVTTKYNNNYGKSAQHKSESLRAKKALYGNVKVEKPSTETDLDGETWRDVVGYEGLYKVSNCGRVKSLRRLHINGGIMRPFRGQRGQGLLSVNLSSPDGTRISIVARLVAIAFVDGYRDGMFVNHKDGNQDNNRADNLEWTETRYNQAHRDGIMKAAARASKPVVQMTLDGDFVAEYSCAREASEHLGKGQPGSDRIRSCCNGAVKNAVAYGYKWKYKKNYEKEQNG